MQKPPPPYEGDEPYFFVCYAHEDSAVVYSELSWLAEQGFRYWYDEGITPGENWPEELAGAIEGAAMFLMFVSPRAVGSEFCLREATFAFGRQKPSLAVHLEETALPRGLELTMGDRQAILRHQQDEARYRERVITALEQHVARSREPEPDPAPTHTSAHTSLAVLPFRLLTPSPADEYLCTALADGLIGTLSAVQDLDVLPWARVAKYAEQSTDALGIARELGVQIIVDASIQKLGGALRVHVQAIGVQGDVLSVARHEGTMTSLFSLQDEIADRLRDDLGLETQGHVDLTPPTQNPAAYELYLQGIERMSKVNVWETRTAIEMLKAATSLDPDFTDAWGRLAAATIQMAVTFEPQDHWFRAAEQAIHNALELDPANAFAHSANGRLLWSSDKGYRNRPALRALGQAMRIDPNSDSARSWHALILMHVGLFDQARRELDAVHARTPDDALTLFFLAHLDHYEMDWEASLARMAQGVRIEPSNFYLNMFSPLITLYSGDLSGAEAGIAAAERFAPNSPLVVSTEGLLWAKRGEPERAEEALRRAEALELPVIHRHHVGHNAAAIYALTGKHDLALKNLREISAEGLPNYPVFNTDPHFESLHDLPDFHALMSDLEREWQEFKTEFDG
jgi:TolB-like protein/tetratricopeptide (TPR) repeat protein